MQVFARTLFRVPATGGDLTELRVSEERFLMYDPQFLPDGSSFLYNATPNTNGPTSLFVASLDGKPVRKLMEADSQVQLFRIPSGRLFGGTDDHLIFRSGTKTMFQQFDTRNALLVGEPAALRERIRARHSSAFIYATFSPAGAMLYQTGSEKSPCIGFVGCQRHQRA